MFKTGLYRLSGEGNLVEGNYTFYWKGKPEDENRQCGVGFALKNSLVGKLEELPLGISERIMQMRIPLKMVDMPLSLVCMHQLCHTRNTIFYHFIQIYGLL